MEYNYTYHIEYNYNDIKRWQQSICNDDFGDINEIINRITNIVEEMKVLWVGESYNNLRNYITDVLADLNKATNVITEYVDILSSYIQEIDDADNNAAIKFS